MCYEYASGVMQRTHYVMEVLVEYLTSRLKPIRLASSSHIPHPPCSEDLNTGVHLFSGVPWFEMLTISSNPSTKVPAFFSTQV